MAEGSISGDLGGGDGEKIGDAYVEVHMDPDKAVDDTAKKIETKGAKKLKKSGEKAGKDFGEGVIKGSLAGMDAGDGDIVKKSGDIGKKAGKETAEKAEKEIKRESPRVTLAGAAMFAGLPAAAAAAGVGVAAGLAAVPLVFAGIAAVAQGQNQEVADSYSNLWDDVVDTVRVDTKPIRETLINVADDARGTFDRLKPQFKAIFSDVGDDIENVTGGVLDLAENAMPGLTTAASKADPVFEGLRKTLGKTGTGVGAFFTNISAGAGASGAILDETGTLIEDLLGFAGTLFAKLANQGEPVFDDFVGVLHQAEDAVLGLAQGALPVLAATASSTLGIFSGALHVLQPISPALGEMASTALTTKFAFAGMNLVSFGTLNKSLDGVKEKVRNANGFVPKMRASLSGLGSAAGIAGIAAFGLGLVMDVMADKEQRAAERTARLSDATETLSEMLDKGANITGTKYLNAVVKVAKQIPGLSDALQHNASNVLIASETALQGGEAWDSYSRALTPTKEEMIENTASSFALVGGLKELREATLSAKEANLAHELSLRHIAATGFPGVDEALLSMAQSTGAADNKTVAASKSTEKLDNSFEVLASNTSEASDKIKALTTVMDIYTGRVPDAEEATQSLNGDMRDLSTMTKEWTDNTKGSQIAIDRHGLSLRAWATSLINADGTINTTTQSGSDFQDVIESVQTDLYSQVTALHESGASHAALTAKVQTTRDAFIKQATQMGFTKQQAVDLANKYGLIPEKVATSIEGNAQGALGAIGSVINGLKSIKDKRVTIKVVTDTSGVKHSVDVNGQRFGIGFNAEGTSSWSGGLTHLAERGYELLHKGSQWAIAPGPMIANVARGTEIIPHEQSAQMMSQPLVPLSGGDGLGSSSTIGGDTYHINVGPLVMPPDSDMAAFANKVARAVETVLKKRK